MTAFDPVHGGMVESTESQREATWAYPDFAGGIAMPMDVWDELVVSVTPNWSSNPPGSPRSANPLISTNERNN